MILTPTRLYQKNLNQNLVEGLAGWGLAVPHMSDFIG